MSEELVLLQTSERTTYTRCRQKWDWAYNNGLTPKQAAAALRFGSLVHEALAVYYKPGRKRGRKPHLTFKDLYDEQLEELPEFGMYAEPDEWLDARTLGIGMLKHYFEEYDTDERYDIIAPEQPFQIDIHDPETDLYICTYVGTFDAVIRDRVTKKIGLFEHKTAKSINTEHLTLDEQAGSYWAFAPDWLRSEGILKKGQELDFILYNFLRKALPDERPRNKKGQCLNKDGSVSKSQPQAYFHREEVHREDTDRAAVMHRVIAQAKEMAMVRAGKLDVYKTPTRDCKWDCPFGPKSGMCEMHEIGDDWEAIRDHLFVEWDPYEGHEEVYEDG